MLLVVRPGLVSEAGLVFSPLQPVVAGRLLGRPADREVGGGAQLVVDDRAIASLRPEHPVATRVQRPDEILQRLGRENARLALDEEIRGGGVGCRQGFLLWLVLCPKTRERRG